MKGRRFQIAVGVLTLALALKLTYEAVFDVTHSGVSTAIALERFPLDLPGAGWRETRVDLLEGVARKAGVSEYVNTTYQDDERNYVWFYVGYYDGTRVESIHQPEICFPGSGWDTSRTSEKALELGGYGNVPLNVVKFVRQGVTRLTAYTFFYEGRFESEQSVVEGGRAFGDRHFAIITISTDERDSIEDAAERLDGMLEVLLPKLLKHLPGRGTRSEVSSSAGAGAGMGG